MSGSYKIFVCPICAEQVIADFEEGWIFECHHRWHSRYGLVEPRELTVERVWGIAPELLCQTVWARELGDQERPHDQGGSVVSVYRSQDWDNGFKAGRDSVAPSFEGEREEGPREIFDRLAESLGGQEKLVDWLLVEVKPLLDAHDSGEREGATPDEQRWTIWVCPWCGDQSPNPSEPCWNDAHLEASVPRRCVVVVAEAQGKMTHD